MQLLSQRKIADKENLIRDERGGIQNIDKQGLIAAQKRKLAAIKTEERLANIEALLKEALNRIRQLEERNGA